MVGWSGRDRRVAATALEALGCPQWQRWVDGTTADFERLATSGDPRVPAPLVAAVAKRCREPLNDRDTVAAIACLGLLGDRTAVEPLRDVLMKSYNGDQRRAAANALAALATAGSREAIAALKTAQGEGGTYVRDEAAAALLQVK